MTDASRKSFQVCAVVVAFGVAAALVLAALALPKEKEFESDGWASQPFELYPPWSRSEILGRAEGHESEPMDEPITRFTPGAFFEEATVEKIEKPGYTATVRDVPESLRKLVFAKYGIDYAKHADYECDHLISLELGGSNAIQNLWPEPYAGEWGARVKDQYEDWLHREVIAHRMMLWDAQQRVARNWKRNMKRDMPDYKRPVDR